MEDLEKAGWYVRREIERLQKAVAALHPIPPLCASAINLDPSEHTDDPLPNQNA